MDIRVPLDMLSIIMSNPVIKEYTAIGLNQLDTPEKFVTGVNELLRFLKIKLILSKKDIETFFKINLNTELYKIQSNKKINKTLSKKQFIKSLSLKSNTKSIKNRTIKSYGGIGFKDSMNIFGGIMSIIITIWAFIQTQEAKAELVRLWKLTLNEGSRAYNIVIGNSFNLLEDKSYKIGNFSTFNSTITDELGNINLYKNSQLYNPYDNITSYMNLPRGIQKYKDIYVKAIQVQLFERIFKEIPENIQLNNYMQDITTLLKSIEDKMDNLDRQVDIRVNFKPIKMSFRANANSVKDENEKNEQEIKKNIENTLNEIHLMTNECNSLINQYLIQISKELTKGINDMSNDLFYDKIKIYFRFFLGYIMPTLGIFYVSYKVSKMVTGKKTQLQVQDNISISLLLEMQNKNQEVLLAIVGALAQTQQQMQLQSQQQMQLQSQQQMQLQSQGQPPARQIT